MLGGWARGVHQEYRYLMLQLVGMKRKHVMGSDPRGVSLKEEGDGLSEETGTTQGFPGGTSG